jgi:hypothetical protein
MQLTQKRSFASHPVTWEIRGDQEGLFKLVTLDRILNRITGVTSGCWWPVVINDIPTYIRYLSNKPTKHIQLKVL